MDDKYLYLIVTTYLNKLKDEKGTLNFCYYLNDYSSELIEKMNLKFNIDYISEHKDEIKEAIEEFFAPLHRVYVQFITKDKFQIVTKVLQDEPHYNAELIQKLVPKIVPFREDLVDDLKTHVGIKLKQEMKDEFLSLIDKNSNEEKDALKVAIKEALDLDRRDLVIYLSDSIVIKQFQLMGHEKDIHITHDNELDSLKMKLFPTTKDVERVLSETSKHLLTHELDFTKIDNSHFANHYKSAIFTTIFNYLQTNFKELQKTTIEKFSIYFTKINLYYFLENMVEYLLNLLIKRDTHAERFIRYYNGEVEFTQDGKYQKPELIDEDGNIWSPSSIITTVLQYHKNLDSIKEIEEDLLKLQEKFKSFEDEIDKYAIERKEIENNLEDEVATKKELNLKIEAINKKIASIKTKELQISRTLSDELKKKKALIETQKKVKDRYDKVVEILIKTIQKDRVKID